MRFLHVVPTYLPAVRYGGPIWAVHGLCKALAARGHEVTVFTTNVDGEGESPVPLNQAVELDGVRVWYFRCGWPRRLYYSPPMAERLLEQVASFDLVHCHSSFLWPPWAAARAARRAGRPYLVSPHGMLVPELVRLRGRWRKTAWIRWFESPSLRAAAGIHVASAAEAAGVAALGFTGTRFHVVPFGVDAPEPVDHRPAGSAQDPPTVLFLGRLSWKKGLDVLIAAMAEVPGARLVVAGNDEESVTARLQARVAELGLRDRVRFAGPVYGDAKRSLLETARVFALPSRGENFAIAALEAMAAGLPVVLSPDVGLAADIRESGAGLVVSATPSAVAGALRHVLGHPAEAEAMGRAGRRLASERFSWDQVARRMEEVALEVLSHP